MPAPELHRLGIVEAADLLRRGALSPVDLVQACLTRIDALNPRLHAFITVTADAALAQARQAAAEICRGDWRGPLHGIPIAYKDVIATRGVRTTAHSNVLRDWVPEADAAVVRALQQAGAITLGKLALWEFAGGIPGPDAAFPPALNPWSTAHSPGGSSSGCGAAVAAGLCFGAIGTDTGGSIRHPAAVCGIVGLKPSWGSLDMDGVLPLAPGFDTVGPLARNVDDTHLLLQAMRGESTNAAQATERPAPSLRGLRLAVPARFIDATVHDATCRAVFEAALERLRHAGAELVPFDFGVLHLVTDIYNQLASVQIAEVHRERFAATPHLYGANFRARLQTAQAPGTNAVVQAERELAVLLGDYDALFDSGIDAIVSPAREDVADRMDSLLAGQPLKGGPATRPYSLTGMPALSLPMGSGAHGMPLGLQLAARHGHDAALLRLARTVETLMPPAGSPPM